MFVPLVAYQSTNLDGSASIPILQMNRHNSHIPVQGPDIRSIRLQCASGLILRADFWEQTKNEYDGMSNSGLLLLNLYDYMYIILTMFVPLVAYQSTNLDGSASIPILLIETVVLPSWTPPNSQK